MLRRSALYDAVMRLTAIALLAASMALLSGCASTSDQTSMRQPLLAGGRGIDHVTILTRNLAAASDEYASRLGFTVGPPRRHSFGLTSASIYFADDTFIELSGVHDGAKVVEVGEGFAVNADEGVRWVTLHSGLITETASFLKQRGIPVWGPFTLPADAKPGQWTRRLIGPEGQVFPGGRLYFVEYNDGLYSERRAEDAADVRTRHVHANSVLGLRSVWVAVRDLRAAAAAYEAAGLIAGPEIRLDVLDTNSREIRTPGGTILLVQTRPETESAGSQDSFSGISLKTENLDRVRALIRQSQSLELRPYQGLYGRSILVPATLARGAWIEFFE